MGPLLCLPNTGITDVHTTPCFCMHSEDQTQVLTLAQQAPYQMRHLPAPVKIVTDLISIKSNSLDGAMHGTWALYRLMFSHWKKTYTA